MAACRTPGGAVYNAGTLTVTNCTFDTNFSGAPFNGSGGAGGAIANEVGTLNVSNSLFVGNKRPSEAAQSLTIPASSASATALSSATA